MTTVAATQVTLQRLDSQSLTLGTLVDSELGTCVTVREEDQLGLLCLTRNNWIEYFPIARQDLGQIVVAYGRTSITTDVLSAAKNPTNIGGVVDYSNMLAISADGLSVCVRMPLRDQEYRVRRVSLVDFTVLPHREGQWGALRYFTDWRLLARFTPDSEPKVLFEHRLPPREA